MGRLIRAFLTAVVLGSGLATSLPAEETPGESEVECPDYPARGTWLMIADPMSVGNVPTPMGGGVDLPYVSLLDCGKRLKAQTNVFRAPIIFVRVGTSLEEWMNVKLKPLEEAIETLEGAKKKAVSGYLSSAKWAIKKGLSPEGGPGPVVYYSGSLPHEPRIFWMLAVTSRGTMKSVLGFGLISEGGGVLAPPHLQVHEWRFHKKGKATWEELEKVVAKHQEATAQKQLEAIFQLLYQVLPPEYLKNLPGG